MTGSRSYLLGLAATLLVVLTACSSPDSAPKPSLEDLAEQSLSKLAGVTSIDARQTAVDNANADRSDPDRWTLNIGVTMAGDATADQVAAAAGATRSFVEEHIGTARWVAQLRVAADEATANPVEISLYPQVRDSAAQDARDAMALKALHRVTRVVITNKVVDVQVANAADLASVLDQLRALPVWEDGGILRTDAGRVQLSDVPNRITLAQAHAFFAASVACPKADFAITSSGRNPEVYINHVTASQARAIISSFTKPALAQKNADGFVLEFNIRAFEGSGTRDTHGTFGERS